MTGPSHRKCAPAHSACGRTTRRLLAPLLAATCLWACGGGNDDPLPQFAYTVEVRTTDSQGQPVPGAMVTLDDGRSAATDSNGRTTFLIQTPAGSWTARTALSGYLDAGRTFVLPSGGGAAAVPLTLLRVDEVRVNAVSNAFEASEGGSVLHVQADIAVRDQNGRALAGLTEADFSALWPDMLGGMPATMLSAAALPPGSAGPATHRVRYEVHLWLGALVPGTVVDTILTVRVGTDTDVDLYIPGRL